MDSILWKAAQTPSNDMIILDKYCQQLGVYVSLRVSMRPSAAGLVNVHLVICILVLDVYCKQTGTPLNVSASR